MNTNDVADKVLTSIEGIIHGDLKWDSGRLNCFQAQNPVSKSLYHGWNVFVLGMHGMANGYENPKYMTYRQAASIGGQVRKGEKSVEVIFWKMLVDKRSKEKDKFIPMLKTYNVFNVSQIDGLPPEMTEIQEGDAQEMALPQTLVDTYLDREGLDVVTTHGTPFYSPMQDHIGMPPLADYASSARYYETIFHEIIHSTGHDSRLKRGLNTDHGAGEYAREELIAEFGSAMLLMQTGSLDGFENLAAYIKSWWTRIKKDPKDLIVAAGKASRAVEYVEVGHIVSEEKAA